MPSKDPHHHMRPTARYLQTPVSESLPWAGGTGSQTVRFTAHGTLHGPFSQVNTVREAFKKHKTHSMMLEGKMSLSLLENSALSQTFTYCFISPSSLIHTHTKTHTPTHTEVTAINHIKTSHDSILILLQIYFTKYRQINRVTM